MAALCLALFAIATAMALVVADRRIDRFPVRLPGAAEDHTIWLLVGSDSRSFVRTAEDARRFGTPRQAGGDRADVVLLVRLDAGSAEVVAIPRDLLIRTADGRPRRLAELWSGGPQPLVDAVCRSLGVAVGHVGVIRFDGLRRLVEAVGGVTVTVNAPTRDLLSGLLLDRPGRHHLDGEAALAWVRSRSEEVRVGDQWVPGPAGRGDRARTVLEQVAARGRPSLAHPVRSARLAAVTTGEVAVDTGAGLFDLLRLTRGLRRPRVSATVPSTVTDTPVPVATLAPGAGEVLARLGRYPHCNGEALVGERPRGGR